MIYKDYISYWYYTYKYPKQSKSTAHVSISILETHILPSHLAQMDIKNIKTKDIQLFLTDLKLSGNKNKIKNFKSFGKPLSAWVLRRIRQWLISSFKLAISENIIQRNYALETESIPIPYKEGSIFTKEQQTFFLEKTKKHRFYLAYVLLFITGCRRSEILGLTWNNVNFEENYIYINKSLIVENNEPILKSGGKTPKSTRVIPLPKKIIKMIKQHKQSQEKEKKTIKNYNNVENLVFTNIDGSMYNPKYFSRNFKDTLKRIGLPSSLHVHSTRHTWATNMIQCNIPITDIQSLGGWSRPDVLLNIYSHTLQESQIKAINTLYNKVITIV